MESFFWDYRLNAEFPFSVLEYTVTDSLDRGAPRLHWHNYCELGVCTAGSGAFYFEDRRYDYRAGDLFLANDLERHGAARTPGEDTRFRHLFRQEMHMSFQEYVSNLRYLEARRLIASTGMPVAAAVREAGFSNPYYFYKMFQKTEGITPSAWRATLRGAQQEQPDLI